MQPEEKLIETETVDLQATVHAYLKAYEERDLERCLSFFAEDAQMKFAFGTYKGLDALTEWHKDRFAADLRILKTENVIVRDNVVTVDAVATSKTALVWRISKFSGRVVLTFRENLIVDARFSLRTTIPIEGW